SPGPAERNVRAPEEKRELTMQTAKSLFVVLFLLLTVASAAGRRDPLTEAETDKLREVALEPFKRLKLLVEFSEARLLAIDQMRSDPKLADGRGKKVHDLLEDFTAILDEINSNLDMYAGRPLNKDDKKDFRKGVKLVIEADDKFELKLRTLKAAGDTDPQAKVEAQEYRYVLQDAEDALKSSADVAREYMNDKDQDKDAGQKKR
ncbi:MAG TPA: hypothetical protein VG759_10985, partial [Candidatus Angelobacter sp.]|nr:hypothetical protein [Candidatus Angelobacter sp.]